jgi:hypothetical protein
MIEVSGADLVSGQYELTLIDANSFSISISEAASNAPAPATFGFWIRAHNVKDPFSLQISFILPNWPARFQSRNFRLLTEKTIRSETPAHLNTYIHWMGFDEMKKFEQYYRVWKSDFGNLNSQ